MIFELCYRNRNFSESPVPSFIVFNSMNRATLPAHKQDGHESGVSNTPYKSFGHARTVNCWIRRRREPKVKQRSPNGVSIFAHVQWDIQMLGVKDHSLLNSYAEAKIKGPGRFVPNVMQRIGFRPSPASIEVSNGNILTFLYR